MNILVLGPQGSGKGTQARRLAERFGFFYFEAGEFLREMGQRKPDISERINRGELIPDPGMVSLVRDFLREKGIADNIIFDGFPRTLKQYRLARLKLDLVFLLEISDEEAVRRLSARRMDPKTGKIYNLITSPPPKSVKKESLVQRDDDQPEAIKKRLKLYKENIGPLLSTFKKEGILVAIDGERPIEVIEKDLRAVLERKLA